MPCASSATTDAVSRSIIVRAVAVAYSMLGALKFREVAVAGVGHELGPQPAFLAHRLSDPGQPFVNEAIQ